MSNLISSQKEKIDVGGKDWVEIPEELSYLQLGLVVDGANSAAGKISMFAGIISTWSFKDDEGKPIVLNKENIEKVKPEILMKINKAINKKIPNLIDKKKESVS
jgi:hypothetical protein